MALATAGRPNPADAPPDGLRLARRCAAGDVSAFEELYSEYAPRWKSIAYNHLGNFADAEDAVQEAFIKIHRAAAGYKGESSFSTWMYRILLNTLSDFKRRKRVRPPEGHAAEEVEPRRTAATVDDEKRLTLAKLIAGLPKQLRTIFILSAIEGFSHAEIAAMTGVTEMQSKFLVFQSKKQLRKQWTDERQHSL